MDHKEAARISELLIYCCDGVADKDHITELESLLDQRPEALEYCVEMLMDLNYFHCMAQTPLSAHRQAALSEIEFMSELDPQQQLELLGDFAEYEKVALAATINREQEQIKPPLIEKVSYERPVRTINKYTLTTAILAAAALLIMIAYVRLAPPQPYEVATLKDSINAQWSSGLPLAAGTRLSSHMEPIRLTRGIVKLVTDDNVEVVLEAPTEFDFASYSEISLNYGRLFARVSQQGYGFSVATPNSKVVDLGTEFGVLSQIDGSTEVYMVKGKANLFAGEKTQVKTSQLLTAGAARKVNRNDSSVREIPMDEAAFVRQIDSGAKLIWKGQESIRLADLLLGGNGFGTAQERTLEFDPLTGATVKSGTTAYRQGPGKITAFQDNPYIDCLFVPSGGSGGDVISSGGHTFTGFPKTTGLYYCNAMCFKGWTFFEPLQTSFMQACRQTDPGVLYLHSNMGLTIDLQVVRTAVPGLRLTDFRTFAGIIRMGANTPDYSELDVWVLVDGQLKYSRQGVRFDQGFDIRINLSDNDRFLTLAVTDGGKIYVEGNPANHFDTCGFVEPVFGLASN